MTRKRTTVPATDPSPARDLPTDVVPGARFLELYVDQMERHPDNIRFEVTVNDETLESIRENGILQPLLVAPGPEAGTYRVIDGNRRHAHLEVLASQGDRIKVPVFCRDDLATDAQQRQAMLITGLQREDLTAAEESAAYEQLALDGLTATEIAKQTGRKVATVRSRLKLAALGQAARRNLHDGQLTIGDAEALASFASDPEATARLEDTLGTSNFGWTLRQEENQRDRAKDLADSVKAADQAGTPLVEPESWNHQDGPVPLSWLPTAAAEPDVHRDSGCLAYAVMRGFFYDVCTDPSTHRTTPATTPEERAERAQQESDWEKAQAQRDANKAAAVAALQLRAEHIAAQLGKTITAKGLGPAAVTVLRHVVPEILGESGTGDGDAFKHLVGLTDVPMWGWVEPWLLEHWPADVTDSFVVKTYVAVLTDQFDTHLAESGQDPAQVTRRVAAWDWLIDTGFAMSDVDEALYAEAIKHADELAETREAS